MFFINSKSIISKTQIVTRSLANLYSKVNTKSLALVLLSAQIVTILALSTSLIQYKPLDLIGQPKTAEAATISSSSISKITQLPEGSGLTKNINLSSTSSSSSISNYLTKAGKSIKVQSLKVKNLDGSESNKISATDPKEQSLINADSSQIATQSSIVAGPPDNSTIKKIDATELIAKTKEENKNNPIVIDAKSFYIDQKGQKVESKDLGNDTKIIDQKNNEVATTIKATNTNNFVKEVSEADSKSKGMTPVVIGLDPDNQIKSDKNFKGAVTDENLMSKAGLAQKKKFLSTQPKTSYKLNAEAWRYCDTQELVNTFCTHYYNGIWQNQFVKMNSNEGNGPHMYNYFGWSSPFWGVNANYWSSKSVGKFWLDAGTYEASTWSDDGIQVFIDNQTVISNYVYQAGTWRSNRITFEQPGWHYIQVDYFQGTADAQRGFDLNRIPDDAPPGAYLRENNDTRIVGNNFNITADAWDAGSSPSGINRVEFEAYYNGSWKYAGQEINDYRDRIFSTAYSIAGDTPSQDIIMRAKVFDNAGRWAYSNWVTKRYTRQIAEKCNMPVNTWCGNYYNSTDYNSYFGNADGMSRHGGWSFTDSYPNASGMPTSQGYSIDHGWWSAVENIRGDQFQGRTHGNFYFPAGNYKFNSTSDDTATIWIADAYYGYGNYGNPRQVLIGNGTSNDVYLDGYKIVIVDYKEYGYQASETIRWDRQPPVTDNGDPDGKVLTATWGTGVNSRCFSFNAQAWDTGSLQRGVKYVRFFALYNSYSNGTWWRDLGTDYNNGDDIYNSGTHCLPNDVGSGASVELSIHVADNVDKYIMGGSSGNRWTQYNEVKTDRTLPFVALDKFKTIDGPNTVQALISTNIYDPASQTDNAEPRSGIKTVKYYVEDKGVNYTYNDYKKLGTFRGSNTYKEVDCVRYCNTSTPVIDLCSRSGLCTGKIQRSINLGIEAEDNAGNIQIDFKALSFNSPASGYSNNNVIMDAIWDAMIARGAVSGDIVATYKAGATLAFDLLLADDFRSCFGIADPHNSSAVNNFWSQILGCIVTTLNVIGIAKLLQILTVISKVKLVVNVATDVDKSIELVKALKEITFLSRGSTGRISANNLTEKLAMEQVKSTPTIGRIILNSISDPRWSELGWVKMSQNINGTEIHYLYNSALKLVDDFKFIN